MDWSILAGKMAEIGLPALGGLFGGPMGATLGGVFGKAVAGALGVEPTPQAVKQAVEERPNDAVTLALAQIETDAKRTEMEYADLANARGQTIALAQAGSNISWGAPVVSVVIAVGFFGVMSLLFFVQTEMSEKVFALFNILFGVLAAQFAQVGNYWLGSSDGSRRSADRLAQVTNAAMTPSPGQVAREAVAATRGRR